MIIPRLSPQSAVAPLTGTPKDLNIYRNTITYFVATQTAQNYVDCIELLVVPCLLLVQIMGIDPTKHRTPETDRCVT